MKQLLKTGAIAGLVGGIALALFMVTVGRGPINEAIALEDSGVTVHSHDGEVAAAHHEELFTRGVQELGGAVGLLIFGVGVGLIVAVVLGATSQRLGANSAFGASLRLGALGFWTAVLIPFLKLPANPPAVGNPDTINQRTLLYFAVLLASIMLTVAVVQVSQHPALGTMARGWVAALLYGVGLLVIFLIMPDNPDEIAISGDLLWRFRLASLGGLAVLWAVMALVMGTLLERRAAAEMGRSNSDSVAV